MRVRSSSRVCERYPVLAISSRSRRLRRPGNDPAPCKCGARATAPRRPQGAQPARSRRARSLRPASAAARGQGSALASPGRSHAKPPGSGAQRPPPGIARNLLGPRAARPTRRSDPCVPEPPHARNQPSRVARMATGWLWEERYAWHDAGIWNDSAATPRNAWAQPQRAFENPETKRRFRNLLDVTGVLDQLVQLRARPATDEEILRVHTPEHLAHVRALAATGGDAGEGSAMGRFGDEIALLAAGGAIVATDAILDGTVANAYALVRPPGHPAPPGRGRVAWGGGGGGGGRKPLERVLRECRPGHSGGLVPRLWAEPFPFGH